MKYPCFINAARKHIHPDIQIRFKNEHWFWRILPEEARKSWTTLGTVIWAPTRGHVEKPSNMTSLIAVLNHEFGHIVDRHHGADNGKDRRPVLSALKFYFLYLAPQAFSFIFLAFFIVMEGLVNFPYHWTWNMVLGFLIPLIPWPSPRVIMEERPYAIGTWIRIRRYANFDDPLLRAAAIESLSKAIRSWTYYKMIWRKKTADAIAERIYNRAVQWCHYEIKGQHPLVSPYKNHAFSNAIMELLEKPFWYMWTPSK
jgi:hypothetical protein